MLAAGLLAGVLTACEPAPPPGQSPARPLPPGPYPDLASVPPRPQLSYTVEQRQQIANQLVADRENARYAAARLAYATGAATEPPPPPPPPPAPAPAPPPVPPAAGDAGIAASYLESNLADVRDTGKLRQFMRRLDREAPDPAGPATLAEALGLSRPSDPPASPGPGAGSTQDDKDTSPDVLGGVLGVERAPAVRAGPTPAPTALPSGAVVAQVAFAAGSTELPDGADAQLEAAVAQARSAHVPLRIVASSGQTGLGAERARAVAASLVRLGAASDRLDLALTGSGDTVLVYLEGTSPS